MPLSSSTLCPVLLTLLAKVINAWLLRPPSIHPSTHCLALCKVERTGFLFVPDSVLDELAQKTLSFTGDWDCRLIFLSLSFSPRKFISVS